MNNSNRYDVETLARQHQKEISDELAARHLLKESGLSSPNTARSRATLLRLVPVVVLAALLLLYFFH